MTQNPSEVHAHRIDAIKLYCDNFEELLGFPCIRNLDNQTIETEIIEWHAGKLANMLDEKKKREEEPNDPT